MAASDKFIEDSEGRSGAYPASVRAQVLKLFEEGQGYKTVSTRTGIPQATIRSWHLDWKVGCFKPQAAVSRTRYPAELRLKAVKLSQSGLSFTQISRELGVQRGTVHKWIARYRAATAPAERSEEAPAGQPAAEAAQPLRHYTLVKIHEMDTAQSVCRHLRDILRQLSGMQDKELDVRLDVRLVGKSA